MYLTQKYYNLENEELIIDCGSEVHGYLRQVIFDFAADITDDVLIKWKSQRSNTWVNVAYVNTTAKSTLIWTGSLYLDQGDQIALNTEGITTNCDVYIFTENEPGGSGAWVEIASGVVEMTSSSSSSISSVSSASSESSSSENYSVSSASSESSSSLSSASSDSSSSLSSESSESSSSSSVSSASTDSSSSSSSWNGWVEDYCATTFTTVAINGTYSWTNDYHDDKPVFNNGTYNLWWDETYTPGVWLISVHVNDNPSQWVTSQDVPGTMTPEGNYVSETGLITAGECSSESSSSSSLDSSSSESTQSSESSSSSSLDSSSSESTQSTDSSESSSSGV